MKLLSRQEWNCHQFGIWINPYFSAIVATYTARMKLRKKVLRVKSTFRPPFDFMESKGMQIIFLADLNLKIVKLSKFSGLFRKVPKLSEFSNPKVSGPEWFFEKSPEWNPERSEVSPTQCMMIQRNTSTQLKVCNNMRLCFFARIILNIGGCFG